MVFLLTPTVDRKGYFVLLFHHAKISSTFVFVFEVVLRFNLSGITMVTLIYCYVKILC